MKAIFLLLFLSISSVLASPVNHQHGGRPHSHALPNEGLNHSHNQGAVGLAITSQPNEPNAVTPVANHPHGYFSGSVKLEQLPDGRRKRLLETLVFTDPKGKQWVAPKGSIVDGASIPKPFWSWIGGPFTGKYLAASVIHDVACVEEKETWQAVHRVFYDGMLAAGVEPSMAKRMYNAVYNHGPRWGKDAKKPLAEKELLEFMGDDLKEISTLDNVGRYDGSSFYMATRKAEEDGKIKDNHSIGYIKKWNDYYLSAEAKLGGGFSISLGKPPIRNYEKSYDESAHICARKQLFGLIYDQYYSKAIAGSIEDQYTLGMYYSEYAVNKKFYLEECSEAKPMNATFSDTHLMAKSWFMKAANQGHSESLYQLGKMYLGGFGFQKNRVEAKKWLSKAAKNGHKKSIEIIKEMDSIFSEY